MPKTMKQMKMIFKKHLKEKIKIQRIASTIVLLQAELAIIVDAHQSRRDGLRASIAAAQQAVLQAQHDLIDSAHRAALQAQHDQAVLQAQHDQLLQQAVDAHENGSSDNEWLIAHEYENEEWEDGV